MIAKSKLVRIDFRGTDFCFSTGSSSDGTTPLCLLPQPIPSLSSLTSTWMVRFGCFPEVTCPRSFLYSHFPGLLQQGTTNGEAETTEVARLTVLEAEDPGSLGSRSWRLKTLARGRLGGALLPATVLEEALLRPLLSSGSSSTCGRRSVVFSPGARLGLHFPFLLQGHPCHWLRVLPDQILILA